MRDDSTAAVAARGVHVRLGTVQALDGLDLTAPAGAIAALHRAAVDVGKEPEQLEITIPPPRPFTVESARQYARRGVHRPVLQPNRFTGSEIDRVIEHAADQPIT